jgi:hypothetical protein
MVVALLCPKNCERKYSDVRTGPTNRKHDKDLTAQSYVFFRTYTGLYTLHDLEVAFKVPFRRAYKEQSHNRTIKNPTYVLRTNCDISYSTYVIQV